MFHRISKCVITGTKLPSTSRIKTLCGNKSRYFHNLDSPLHSTALDNPSRYSFEKIPDAVDGNLSKVNDYRSLREIFFKLRRNSANSPSIDQGSHPAYASLNDLLLSLDLSALTTNESIKVLILLNKILKVSRNQGTNSKIRELLAESLTNLNVEEISKVLKVFAKNNHSIDRRVLINVMERLSWPEDLNPQNELLYDLFWSFSHFRVNLSHASDLLRKLIVDLPKTNLVDKVKFLNSLYLYLEKNYDNLTSSQNSLLLRSTSTSPSQENLTREPELLQYLHSANLRNKNESRNFVQTTIDYVKNLLLANINDFDTIRPLTNFIFYVTSTVNNFTLHDYTSLTNRLLELFRADDIQVEGLIQLLWSLQRNNLYPSELLNLLSAKFDAMLGTFVSEDYTSPASDASSEGGENSKTPLSIGQLSLCLYSLTYFNLLTTRLSRGSLNYLQHLLSTKDQDPSDSPTLTHSDLTGHNLLRVVNVLWSACVSNVTKENDATIYERVVGLLNSLNWSEFLKCSEFEDLRKMAQVFTVLRLEGKFNELQIPENALRAVQDTCNNSVDYKMNSVTQDKIRRILKSCQIHFENEYQVDNHMAVDFVLRRTRDAPLHPDTEQDSGKYSNSDPGKDLVIEIDGPYHFNILMTQADQDESQFGEVVKFGNLKLVLNGKTLYRNKILERIGFHVSSIPWFSGYQNSFYSILKALLTRHKFLQEHT